MISFLFFLSNFLPHSLCFQSLLFVLISRQLLDPDRQRHHKSNDWQFGFFCGNARR
jgi:hypothetical protein